MPFDVGRPFLKSTGPMRASMLCGNLSGSGCSLPGSCACTNPAKQRVTTRKTAPRHVLLLIDVITSSFGFEPVEKAVEQEQVWKASALPSLTDLGLLTSGGHSRL